MEQEKTGTLNIFSITVTILALLLFLIYIYDKGLL